MIRPDGEGFWSVAEVKIQADLAPAPLHGTKYPTQEAAERAAYDAGLTAFMVYEDKA